MTNVATANSIYTSVQSQLVARRTLPTTPAPAPTAPAPSQAELVASMQDAAYKNDLNRFALLSSQLQASSKPSLQTRAATIPTSGGAWGVAQTMNTPVK